MTIATAVYLKTMSGDEYLFCEPDGFVAESLTAFLQKTLGDEYAWIEKVDITALNWDIDTLDMVEVYDDIYAANDKIEIK